MSKRRRPSTPTRTPSPPAWTPFEFTRYKPDHSTGSPEAFFANSRYVAIACLPVVGWAGAFGDYDLHLSIRRHDREAEPFTWRDMQRIKSELCGSEAEGVEMFPAESRLLDGANQRHMWVRKPGRRWEFGMESHRTVVDPDVWARLVADDNVARQIAHASGKTVAEVQGGQYGQQQAFEDGIDVNLGHDGIAWPHVDVMWRLFREQSMIAGTRSGRAS